MEPVCIAVVEAALALLLLVPAAAWCWIRGCHRREDQCRRGVK